jgi:transcriptional regulator with XRE-family HTH domain
VEKSIYSEDYQRLVLVLRNVRNEAAVTQVELAARLGVHQSFVSKYENLDRRIDVAELRAVCVALGVSLRSVIDRWERAEPPPP